MPDPTTESWHLYSYEGPRNGPERDKHGASFCIGTLAMADEEHECVGTMCGESEEAAKARGRMAASAPDLYRALAAAVASAEARPIWIAPLGTVSIEPDSGIESIITFPNDGAKPEVLLPQWLAEAKAALALAKARGE